MRTKMNPNLPNDVPLLSSLKGQQGVSIHATAGPNGPFAPFFVGEPSVLTPVVVVVLVAFTALYGVMVSSTRRLAAPTAAHEPGDHPVDAAVTDELDAEFLHPTERVLDHLRRNDGRAFQQDLVNEFDKSAASVSRYLSELEDADRVRRVRVDRNNLVILGDQASIDASKSEA